MSAKKGAGHRGWFRRCVKHVNEAHKKLGHGVFDAHKICGAALREKRKRAARRKHH